MIKNRGFKLIPTLFSDWKKSHFRFSAVSTENAIFCNLVRIHELICHFIRFYLVPLPPTGQKPLGNINLCNYVYYTLDQSWPGMYGKLRFSAFEDVVFKILCTEEESCSFNRNNRTKPFFCWNFEKPKYVSFWGTSIVDIWIHCRLKCLGGSDFWL